MLWPSFELVDGHAEGGGAEQRAEPGVRHLVARRVALVGRACERRRGSTTSLIRPPSSRPRRRCGRSCAAATRRPCRCPGTRSTSSDARRRQDQHRPGPASPGGRPPGPTGKQTTSPGTKHALAVGAAQRRRPDEHDEPLLDPVVEVDTDRCARRRRARRASRRSAAPPIGAADPRAPPPVPVALGGVVELGREDVRPPHARKPMQARAPRRARRGPSSRPSTSGMPALAVDAAPPASRRRARPRCPRGACRRPSPPAPAPRRARSSSARKIDSCGFVFPCACEVSTASAVEPVVGDELVEVPRRVREQPDLQPALRAASTSAGSASSYSSKCAECAQRRSISTAAAIGVAPAAHAEDDPLGEEHPDLLVVVELGMPLHLRERRRARLVVPRRVELEPVAAPELPVPVRPEVRPRPCEGEVDVEDDRAQHAHEDRSGCGACRG